MNKFIKRSLLTILTGAAALVVYGSVVVYQARNKTRDELLPQWQAQQFALPVAALTEFQKDALIRIEDPQFYQHQGIDVSTPGAGLTTITQAIVKRFYFERFSPGIAKIKQSLIARYALDPLVSKDLQLAVFINHAYFGAGTIGFAAAAERYFQRPFAQLDQDQYLSLLAMLIGPNKYSEPTLNAERVRRIKAVLSGAYQPRGVRDVEYDGA